MNFILDTRLATDTHPLGNFDGCLLRLSKNALFPWFILVPETNEIEFHKLGTQQQAQIQQHINAVAEFITRNFATEKINIASIGNIVSQMHIHIIGRHKNDACWPNVVWGAKEFTAYEKNEVDEIKAQLGDALKDSFHVSR